MSIAVSNVTQSQPLPPPARTSTSKPPPVENENANNGDSVTLSPAAQARLDALKQSQAASSQGNDGGDIAALKLQSRQEIENPPH